jgi:hypothetical protein
MLTCSQISSGLKLNLKFEFFIIFLWVTIIYYICFVCINYYLTMYLSATAGTLGTLVRIPLEGRMYEVFSEFVLSCVGSDLAKDWQLVQ